MRSDINTKLKLGQLSRRYYRPESEVELASLTRCEKVYTKIVETPSEGAKEAALDIAAAIERCVEERGRCVIALGAGKGALDVYDELVRLYFADKVSFAKVVAFNISELGLGQLNEDAQNNFRRLQERLFSRIDIDPSNVYTFDEGATKENVHQHCRQYETLIDSFGGIDVLVCQLTKNGGLAFNEPGSQSTSASRLVLLSNDSRQRIADSYQCEVAPDTAVTLGLANLLAARKIICVAWGEASAESVYNTIEGRIGDNTPASFLQMHHDVKLLVDLEAAALLTRISFPWKVTSCEWTDVLVRRAIVWLSEQTGKPILKLTNKDYNDNGLSELVTVFGSGYDVNIRIFNEFQHTITGWPGGKPNADDASRPERATPYPKRVVCFSPHPDDVVVSMGGTLRRLVQQGHDVHVAFQTNGDMMVSDEDLERTIMLTNRLSSHFGLGTERRDTLINTIEESLRSKKPGDADSPENRYAKGLILTCECIKSCAFLGVNPANIHEMNLPFYSESPLATGKVTEADVAPIKKLLQELRPHQIFFADDYDPNGVNERASEALVLAVMQLKNEPWMKDCRLWMYRGQWGQWEIDHVEMTVPMSPEEFSVKRQAILKHQSQVHDAPFRDPENGQLAWQTSIDRNSSLADRYSRLGLASYEAMEAFVRYHIDE
ncbi:MAG: PIG-L family deacetylase [Bacteroidales bacterium]|nr:PIG-L family deacetylase [Bacteroidales bacterium]